MRRAESRTLAREPLGGQQGRSLARGAPGPAASGGAAGRGGSRSVSSSRSRSGSPGGGGRWGGGLSSREADLVLSVLGAGDDDDTDAGSSVAGSELEESVSEVALSLSLASDAEAGGEGAAGEAAGRETGPAGRSERLLLLDLSDCPSEDSLASWASQAPGPPAGVPEPGHRVEHALAAQARDSLALAEGLRSVLEGREAELAEAKVAVRALQNRLEEERKQGAGRTAGRVQSGQMDFMRTELEMLQGELKAKDGAVADAKRESQQLRQALLDAELDLERVGARTGLLEGRIRDLEGSREKEYAATGVQAGDARVDEPAGLGGAVPWADHDIVVTENRALGLDLGAQRTIIQRLETQNQNLKDQMERITSAANNYKAQCDERIEGIKADLEQRTKEMLEQEHRAQCLQEKLLDSEESTDKSNLLLKVKEDSSESLQKTLADKDAMLNAAKLEVRALLQERDTLRGKVRDLEAVLDTQRSRATDAGGLLQTAEIQIGVLKKEVLALEKKATGEKQRGFVLNAETEKWRSQSQLQMHQIEALGQELEVEKMSRLAAAARAEDMSAQLASTNAAKAATAAAVFDLKKQVDSLKHELNMRVLELEARLGSAQNERDSALRRLKDAKAGNSLDFRCTRCFHTDNERLETVIERKDRELEAAQNDLRAATAKAQGLSSRLVLAKQELVGEKFAAESSTHQKTEELEQELRRKGGEAESLRKKARSLQSKLETAEAELAAAKAAGKGARTRWCLGRRRGCGRSWR